MSLWPAMTDGRRPDQHRVVVVFDTDATHDRVDHLWIEADQLVEVGGIARLIRRRRRIDCDADRPRPARDTLLPPARERTFPAITGARRTHGARRDSACRILQSCAGRARSTTAGTTCGQEASGYDEDSTASETAHEPGPG